MLSIDETQAQFRAQAATIQALTADVSLEQARWKPDADAWSILEVINHLADEERDDFRTRLDLTLHQPETDWPPIDPQGWVTQRRYNEREWQASVEDFANERSQSLDWLDSLSAPDWDQAHVHPRFGGMSAGELMASWLAHDLLHIRQLVELHFLYLTHQTKPYGVGYAGEY